MSESPSFSGLSNSPSWGWTTFCSSIACQWPRGLPTLRGTSLPFPTAAARFHTHPRTTPCLRWGDGGPGRRGVFLVLLCKEDARGRRPRLVGFSGAGHGARVWRGFLRGAGSPCRLSWLWPRDGARPPSCRTGPGGPQTRHPPALLLPLRRGAVSAPASLGGEGALCSVRFGASRGNGNALKLRPAPDRCGMSWPVVSGLPLVSDTDGKKGLGRIRPPRKQK